MQRLGAVLVAVQPDVAVAERGQQRVVQPTDGAGRVAVVHPLLDDGVVGAAEQLAELGQGGDLELEEQPGDPVVVVGARPARVGVLAGEERRQLARRDPRGRRRRRRRRCRAPRSRSRIIVELAVRQLEQPGGHGEAPVELVDVLGRDLALVADVVLELGPRVLEHRAQLDLDLAPAELELEVPAGVAEPALARGELAEVAVVEHDEVLRQQGRGRVDVAGDEGDHADAELVADVAQRVRVEQRRPPRCGRPSR